MENLRRYIVDEVMNKSEESIDADAFELVNRADVPEQENGCDCGVFACKFADFDSAGKEFFFRQEHMPYFRERLVAEVRFDTGNPGDREFVFLSALDPCNRHPTRGSSLGICVRVCVRELAAARVVVS